MDVDEVFSESVKPEVHILNTFVKPQRDLEGINDNDIITRALEQQNHSEFRCIISQLSQFNCVRLAAYRTALKLRFIQKKLQLNLVPLPALRVMLDTFSILGDPRSTELLKTSDMIKILTSVYSFESESETDFLTQLTAHYFNECFAQQKHGGVRKLSFKIGLVLLCSGNLNDKFEYLFGLIGDENGVATLKNLELLLEDCMKIPRQLQEDEAFGGSNINLAVSSCLEQAKNDTSIDLTEFLTWIALGPQCLIWLHVLARISRGESVAHVQTCDTCSHQAPIIGLRFRCLKCFNFNMCQECFLTGRQSKRHRLGHPMHEYCWEASGAEEFQDYARVIKNCFKSKKSIIQAMGSGYLPLNTVKQNYNELCDPSPIPTGSPDLS